MAHYVPGVKSTKHTAALMEMEMFSFWTEIEAKEFAKTLQWKCGHVIRQNAAGAYVIWPVR